MPRLAELSVAEMTDEQRRIHDTIAAGPRGQVRGPLAVWLRRPQFADRAQALGQYCRYDSSLPKRLSELAILVTARIWGSEFEWWAHKTHALSAGLAADIIETIRTHQTPNFKNADEAVVYDVSNMLSRVRRLTDELYARALSELGEAGLIDLIGVLGYYTLISMTINTFEVIPPDEARYCFE